MKKETNKNESEIKEKCEELSKLKTLLSQYLKKQVIFLTKLEEQKSQLKLLLIGEGGSDLSYSNEEEQVKIVALLNEIDNSLVKVKSDWEKVRESFEPEEFFPKDWEEASSVFFDFDGASLTEEDENLSDSEIDSELKELEEKFNNLLDLGKSALEDKRIVSQSPIKEDFELEERERKFDEDTWKIQEEILRNQDKKNAELDQLCKSVEEYEQKEFIKEQNDERQRSKIAWEILDLYIQLEEELKDLDEKKQVSEEKIKTLEEVVFLLKIAGEKIGLEDEEIEEKIFQIAHETVQDQELLSQLLTVYNNSFSRGKAYNKEKEIIKRIINELGLELEQDSSLNEVIEFIKNLIRSPITNEANEEIKDELENVKGQIEEVETELDLAKKKRDELKASLDKEVNKVNTLNEKNSEFLNSLGKAEEEITKFKRESSFQHNIEVN